LFLTSLSILLLLIVANVIQYVEICKLSAKKSSVDLLYQTLLSGVLPKRFWCFAQTLLVFRPNASGVSPKRFG